MAQPVPRIASVEAVPLRFPLTPPFRAAVRLIDSVDLVLLRLRDSEGREGIGIAFAFGAADALPLLQVARSLGQTRVGRPSLEIERHWQEMCTMLALAGLSGYGICALAAIDMALWDLAGKAFGQPLWRLLGGARDAAPAYASAGSLALPLDALVDECAGFVSKGHRTVKIKAGHGIAGDRERILAVRQAVGDGMAIAVDGNQQWTPKQAIRWAGAMQDCALQWIEEPVRADDFQGHAEVRTAVSADLATGENIFGTGPAGEAIAARCCDVFMPNLQRVGGITGWRKIAAAAELAGLPVAGHVYPEFNVHLMCAVPNAASVELWPGWPWLWQEQVAVLDGMVKPPDGPGLGFTLDEQLVAAHRSAS